MSEGDPMAVLVVDDEVSTLRLLEKHLTKAGYKVITAEHGADAMQILLTEGPPIVITDWVMPEMDGIELCRAIREHEAIPFAYVIMMTAHQTTEDRLIEALNAGADDYLCKPLKIRELLARLRAVRRIVELHHELDARNLQVHRYNAQMEITTTKLSRANEELNRMATTDELTGLTNRREALGRLAGEWSSSQRHGYPLTVMALDIDHFKSCNDIYGHAAGDVVLKETAHILRASARREECVCRVGGEEFLVLCPHATEETAAIGAERIRGAVEANVIRHGNLTLRVTISLGVAQRTATMKTADDLLRAADAALYCAKDAGRNIVRLASKKQHGAQTGAAGQEPSASLPTCATGKTVESGTILLVDDDESLRLFCRKFLQRDGHDVREATNGMEALAKVNEDPPNVIIMDAVMPRMSGLECTRRLKADPATAAIPVIIASARTDATDIVTALEAGADEHLVKPINPKELMLRVNTMMRLSHELARSYAVRGEQSRALGLLMEFSHDISAADSLDEILERTIGVTAAITCSRRVSIMLPDADGRQLRVAKSLGFDPDAVAAIRVPIGVETSGRVFQTRQSVVVDTVESATRRGGEPDALLLNGVPNGSISLCAPHTAVGVLNITGQQDSRPYAPAELEYLDLICNITAGAIHERLTRRARDEARHSIVVAMAKLAEHRDSDTGKHLERVSRFCILLAKELRADPRFESLITEEFLYDLQRAVPLHDIGKVAVPDQILRKPGPLSAEETAVMRTHSSIGARTIRSVIERTPGATFLNMAEDIAGAHHEWFNGQGYPLGLRGEAIPLAARITSVADVYDAITNKRVYKEAMSHKAAVRIITEFSGRQFDPDVVQAFHQCESQFERLAVELADDPSSSTPCVGTESLPGSSGQHDETSPTLLHT